MTKAEERENQAIVEYGCFVCRKFYGVYSFPHIHHVRRHGQKRGLSPKIGLCPVHHQTGGHGVAIHAGRETWEQNYGSEIEMAETLGLELAGR